MPSATLTKWGNSQGIILPKSLCEKLGWVIGERIEIHPGANRTVILSAPQRHFERTRCYTIEELFETFDGTYEPPADLTPIGAEADWGEPAGAEVW